MRPLSLCLLLLFIAGCVSRAKKSAPISASLPAKTEPLPLDRRAADAEAQKRLMELHFFDEGRGMHLPPGYTGLYNAVAWSGITKVPVQGRWGFNLSDRNTAGLYDVRYKGMTVGVAGCAACHSGKAAGRFYPGLGNKNFDVTQLGMDLSKMESLTAKVTPFTGEKREVEKSALGFANTVSDSKIGNLTQGMVPVSFIFGWFYQQSDDGSKPVTRGAVKVPALWGYGSKREAGLFCDGYGVGRPPGWAVAVELTSGQKPETVRAYLPAIEHAEESLMALLPAPYPFAIDAELARRGAPIFAQNCQECHGSYARDSGGLPRLQPPKWIPLAEVGTDSDRADLVTDQFQQLVKRSVLSDLIKVNPKHRQGYFAPRLEGIWARFPYLHNGSVPNIRALLTPPEERPTVFSLKRAGERERFDEKRLGLTVPSAHEASSLLKLGGEGQRNVYDGRRLGHSCDGHTFGTELDEEDKSALIEYLKTL